jgi:hypothetical protein
MSKSPNNTIIVHIRPDDDNDPKIAEPSLTSSQTIVPGQPITWSILNFCSKPQLWIQLQGFTIASSSQGVSDTSSPMLFGEPVSFGTELKPAGGTPPEPQTITSGPTLATAKGSSWQYSILLLSNKGVEDKLDPIVVLSGD